MYPYVQVVVPKGQWHQKNKQSDIFEVDRIKLHNRNDLTQTIRMNVRSYDQENLKAWISDKFNSKYGDNDNKEIEVSMELQELRPDLFELVLNIKASECNQDRTEFINMIGGSIKLSVFALDLGNKQLLEIEPDNENSSLEAFENLNSICREIALRSVVLGPEKADELLGFPISKEEIIARWNHCLTDTSSLSQYDILHKMNCLTSEAIQSELEIYYGKETTDSLYLLGNQSAIDEYYVRKKRGEQAFRNFAPYLRAYRYQFSYKEFDELKKRILEKEYSLDTYLNAIFGINSDNDLERFTTISIIRSDSEDSFFMTWQPGETISVKDARFLPEDPKMFLPFRENKINIQYNEATFYRILESTFLTDTAHIVSAEHNLISNGIVLTFRTTRSETKNVLFTYNDGLWQHSLIKFPADSDALEKWSISEQSTPTTTIFNKANSLHYLVQSVQGKDNPWVEIKPLSFDSSLFILADYHKAQGKNHQYPSYDHYLEDSFNHIFWKTIKDQSLFDTLIYHLKPEILTFEDVISTYSDNPDILEILPGQFILQYTLMSYLESDMAPSDKIHIYGLIVDDLDNDKQNELYQYALCNGKIIYVQMFRDTPNGLIEVKKSVAEKLLMKDNIFRGNLINSLRGNYEDKRLLKK